MIIQGWINVWIIYIYFLCIREILRFVHPRKVIFTEGNIWLFSGEQIFISPLCKGNECFIPPGQRFGEFCQMKSYGHLCLQNYYFGTSLELSLRRISWNLVVIMDIICKLVICLLSHFIHIWYHDLSMRILYQFYGWLIFARVIAFFMFPYELLL